MNARDPMFIHYVEDMDRALWFYRDVIGLEVVDASPGWSTLRCGGCTVALHILGPGMNEAAVDHAGLNLCADDLDGAVAEVIAGGGHVKEVREAGGGVPVRMRNSAIRRATASSCASPSEPERQPDYGISRKSGAAANATWRAARSSGATRQTPLRGARSVPQP